MIILMIAVAVKMRFRKTEAVNKCWRVGPRRHVVQRTGKRGGFRVEVEEVSEEEVSKSSFDSGSWFIPTDCCLIVLVEKGLMAWKDGMIIAS